jgi:hypothetical protein
LADLGGGARLFGPWNPRSLKLHHSMKMSPNIDQFSYVKKLATLTQLYLELNLPLMDALRAADADL